MKKNPYLTFSLVAGGLFVAYLILKKNKGMVIPPNVDVSKPASSGGGGGGASATRMPSMPIITPPVVVIPQTTTTTQVAPNAPVSQTTSGSPTKTTVDNPDTILGGAVVPSTSTTVQTSSGTLSVPTSPAPPALGKTGGIAG